MVCSLAEFDRVLNDKSIKDNDRLIISGAGIVKSNSILGRVFRRGTMARENQAIFLQYGNAFMSLSYNSSDSAKLYTKFNKWVRSGKIKCCFTKADIEKMSSFLNKNYITDNTLEPPSLAQKFNGRKEGEWVGLPKKSSYKDETIPFRDLNEKGFPVRRASNDIKSYKSAKKGECISISIDELLNGESVGDKKFDFILINTKSEDNSCKQINSFFKDYIAKAKLLEKKLSSYRWSDGDFTWKIFFTHLFRFLLRIKMIKEDDEVKKAKDHIGNVLSPHSIKVRRGNNRDVVISNPDIPKYNGKNSQEFYIHLENFLHAVKASHNARRKSKIGIPKKFGYKDLNEKEFNDFLVACENQHDDIEIYTY